MFFFGACFFIERSKFDDIGLFDENIFMYGEENDLHHRLRSKSHLSKMIFDKEMAYLHLIENRSDSIKTKSKILESNLYFCKKNGLSEVKMIQRTILNASFFRLIDFIKFNKKSVETYNEWIKILKGLKVKYSKV
jgi:GT2 family glycosyltransferase